MSPSASIAVRKCSLTSSKSISNPPSSSDSSIQSHKKSKNSSNLPDCHCCGSQGTQNPQIQLQTLESHWRIVPLCVICVNLVNSGGFCSYCLLRIGDDDDFMRCRSCERRIHSDCIVNCNGFAPWSYSCSGFGFSVCVDCWVPKSIRVPNSGNFEVLNDGFKALEDAVVATDCEVEDKVDCWVPKSIRVPNSENSGNFEVLNGGFKVLEDAVVAADCAVEDKVDCWVPKSIRVPNSGNSGNFEVLNDGFKALEDAVVAADCAVEEKVALATKAREKALRKSVEAKRAVELANNALDLVAKSDKKEVSEMDVDNVVVDDAKLAFELHRAMNSSRRIRRPKNSNGGSLVKDIDSGPRGFCKKIEICSYNKINLNYMESVVPDVALDVAKKCNVSKEVELINSSSGDDNSMLTEFQSCRKRYDDRFKQIDRYLMKYCKRSTSLKEISECETNMCCKGFCLESQGSGSEVTVNCSKESRALFDSSLRPLQALGCTSGPSQNQT